MTDCAARGVVSDVVAVGKATKPTHRLALEPLQCTSAVGDKSDVNREQARGLKTRNVAASAFATSPAVPR